MKKNDKQQEECFVDEAEKPVYHRMTELFIFFGWELIYLAVCIVFFQLFSGAISEVSLNYANFHLSGLFLFIVCITCWLVMNFCRFFRRKGIREMTPYGILGGSLVPILLTCTFRYRCWYWIVICILIVAVAIAFVSGRKAEEKSFSMFYQKAETVFTYLLLIYGVVSLLESTYSYQKLLLEYKKQSANYEQADLKDMNQKKWEALSGAERINYLDWIVGRETEYFQMPGVYITMSHNHEIDARYEPGEFMLRWNSGIADASYEQGVEIALRTIYHAYEQYMVAKYDDSFEAVKEAYVDEDVIELWRREISFSFSDSSQQKRRYWMEKMAQRYAEKREKEYM